MSINVEIALVLGLFIIGALVLAIDNIVDAMYKRLTRWLHKRRVTPVGAHPVRSGQKKRL